MFYLRDIPKFEAISARVRRYPDIDPSSVEGFLILLRVASDALAAVESYLNRFGMSQGRFTVLAVLNREPETAMCPSDLADRCGVTRATMTGLLDGLERDKLVKREHHGDDRRMTHVRLTPEGIKFLDSLLPEYYRRQAKLMGNLSEADKKLLVEMLAKINAGIPSMAQ
jgi:MarR family transcriptional regulator, negative regulator of the multidrug operon emrRAB